MNRRGFIFGLGATLAVIRTPGLIMPVRKVLEPESADLFDLIQAHYDRMINPPLVAEPNISTWFVEWSPDEKHWGPEPARYERMRYDAWLSRTIKAPPGGFKIARI